MEGVHVNMQRLANSSLKRILAPLATACVVAGAITAVALARADAAPTNTAAPTISGTEREGQTLTASNGTWGGSPTTFAYQWQRCTNDGLSCGDIAGATEKTYTLATGDVTHAVRVIVTAGNADGKTAAPSDPTEAVSAKNGPTNSVKPALSGPAQVGEELSVTNGTWSPTPTAFGRQWQRCEDDGTACRNIVGATGSTYGVRTADVGHRLRARIAARTSGGVAYALSGTTGVIAGTPTGTTTTTVQGNRAPGITFISLKRVGARVFARFRVCDDRPGRVTIIERDNKARALAYTRRFTVIRAASCSTFSRSWIPAPRFRTKGRYVVTLRAQDTSRALSRIVSRSLVKR
jgi:hypothetical protein